MTYNMGAVAAAVSDLSCALISVSRLTAGDSRVKVGCKQLQEEPEVQPQPIREQDLGRVIFYIIFYIYI